MDFAAHGSTVRGHDCGSGFMPAPVGGEVGRAVEDLVALGTAVLDVDDVRAAVLGQEERSNSYRS